MTIPWMLLFGSLVLAAPAVRAEDDDEAPTEESAPAAPADAIDSSAAKSPGGAGLGSAAPVKTRSGGGNKTGGRSGGGGGGGTNGDDDEDGPAAAAVGKPVVTTWEAVLAEGLARRGFGHGAPIFSKGLVYALAYKPPTASSYKTLNGEYGWGLIAPDAGHGVCEQLSYSISLNPGDMKGICSGNSGVDGNVRWAYGNGGRGTCSIPAGKTFYFNLRCNTCVEGSGEGYQNQRPATACSNISLDRYLWVNGSQQM